MHHAINPDASSKPVASRALYLLLNLGHKQPLSKVQAMRVVMELTTMEKCLRRARYLVDKKE